MICNEARQFLEKTMTLQEYRNNLEVAETIGDRSDDLRVAGTASAASDSTMVEHKRRVASFAVALPHPADSWCHKGEWHTPRMKSVRGNRRRDGRRPMTSEMPSWV